MSPITRPTTTSFCYPLRGEWTGSLADGTSLTFVFSSDIDPLYISCEDRGFTGYNVTDYKEDANHFSFTLPYYNDHEYYDLSLDEHQNLKAKVSYGEHEETIELTKVSDVIAIPQYTTEEYAPTYDLQVKKLRELGDYNLEEANYTFTYELGNKTVMQDFITGYDLDTTVADQTDTELMASLLHWVCKKCNHSSYGFPANRDVTPSSLMAHYEKTGGLNCRALSLLLAQLLRAYGVPARIMTCMPNLPLFQDCHVIVEAYSYDLGKWVMLDPTYDLMLQDEMGIYINTLELREAILNNTPLTPNATAGYNEGFFDLQDYKQYMAKNTALLISTLQQVYGMDTRNNETPDIVLVPENFVSLAPNKQIMITHNATYFYAAPKY